MIKEVHVHIIKRGDRYYIGPRVVPQEDEYDTSIMETFLDGQETLGDLGSFRREQSEQREGPTSKSQDVEGKYVLDDDL